MIESLLTISGTLSLNFKRSSTKFLYGLQPKESSTDVFRKPVMVMQCSLKYLMLKKEDGSLPAFVAAFAKRKKLSRTELDELQKLIDEYRR